MRCVCLYIQCVSEAMLASPQLVFEWIFCVHVGTSVSKCVKVLKHCLPRTSSVRYVIVEVETFHLLRLETVPRAQMVLKSWNLQKRYFKTHMLFFSEISNKKKDWILCCVRVLMYVFPYIRVWVHWIYIVWTVKAFCTLGWTQSSVE